MIKNFSYITIIGVLLASCVAPDLPPINTIVHPTATTTISVTNSDINAQTQWLKTNAIPFNTTEPNASFEDLMPLKQIVGNARIVALGEATHGTHEFFQMKHRILEFLVENMGFNTFAIEANWSEASLINDYVHNGQGDPAKLVHGLYFWTWDTEEVLDIILWMRAYNEDSSHISKVSFAGFDMQYDSIAKDNVVQYLHQVEGNAADQITNYYSCWPQASLECQDKYQAVYDWLSQRQTDYTARSSSEEFAQALQSARVVVQCEDLNSYGTSSSEYFSIRDRYMAENVAWLLKQAGPNAKIVLWAHNGHVGVSEEQSPLSMGSHLRMQFGSQMVVFGFLFYQGSFNASDGNSLKTFQVGIPPTDSYEFYFHSTGLPHFFLDLRSAKVDSPATDWLLTPHLFRMIGAVYNPNNAQLYFWHTALAKVFDVVIYFQDTSPSLLLNK